MKQHLRHGEGCGGGLRAALRSLPAPRGGGDYRLTAQAACVRDRRQKFVDNTDRGSKPDHADGEPRPAAVTFVTTEHFTLQGARSSTIAESTGWASAASSASGQASRRTRRAHHDRNRRHGTPHPADATRVRPPPGRGDRRLRRRPGRAAARRPGRSARRAAHPPGRRHHRRHRPPARRRDRHAHPLPRRPGPGNGLVIGYGGAPLTQVARGCHILRKILAGTTVRHAGTGLGPR